MYSQQELDAKLLAAANALRGPVEPSNFKSYIFPLLFLKRISDNWHWERARALASFNGDEELAALPENYRFVVPEGCLWDDVLKLHENVGAGLQLVFDRLQEANPDTLAGVFGTARWADTRHLPEERLTRVLDVFTGLKLDPDSVTHDLLGNAYEYLLKNFADESGKKAGEFFTPRAVVRLLVQLLDPQENETVYDPTCGSGGMLVEAVNQVRAHGQDPRTLRLFGQEVQPDTAAIARMNLYLHDIETFAIKRGDTLRNPRFREQDGALTRFDAVIANPPFSLKEWGWENWAEDPFGRADYGVPPKGYADLAFVEHMLVSMNENTGRVAVVLPHGVLFRSGTEKEIRRRIVEKGQLDAVIGLAPNLFYNTTIPACVLVFRAAPSEGRDGQVLFIDAAARFKKGKNQNELPDEDVAAVLEAYRTGEDPDGEGGLDVSLVSVVDIESNDWDLNIGRYIEGVEAEAVNLDEALTEFRSAQEALRAAEKALDEQLTTLGLGS